MIELGVLCTIKNGKLKIFDRESFDQGLSQFGEGEELDLIIRPVGRVRTRAQEKFFHGPICKAFEALGYRKQEAKEMLCLRFIPQEIRMIDGSVAIVPGHTSKLKVEEYNELIEQSIQLAAENGQLVLDGGEWRARRAQDARTARKAS